MFASKAQVKALFVRDENTNRRIDQFNERLMRQGERLSKLEQNVNLLIKDVLELKKTPADYFNAKIEDAAKRHRERLTPGTRVIYRGTSGKLRYVAVVMPPRPDIHPRYVSIMFMESLRKGEVFGAYPENLEVEE